MTTQPETKAISLLLAGGSYLKAGKYLLAGMESDNGLKQGFGKNPAETLVGHGTELIFKAHFRALGETTAKVTKRNHNLTRMLDEILSTPYAVEISQPALQFCRQIDPTTAELQAVDELKAHIEFLNLRTGIRPFPARYPVSFSGLRLTKAASLDFVIYTLEAFARAAHGRCMEAYTL